MIFKIIEINFFETFSETNNFLSPMQIQMTKPLYLSVNKLCDKLEEYIEAHKEKDPIIDSAYEFYIIIDKEYLFPDKFNANRIVCRPLVVSIYKNQQFLYKELCELFDCEKVYLCFNKKGSHYSIDTAKNGKNKIQDVVIVREPKKFTTKDGKEIEYHQMFQYDAGFLIDEIDTRIKSNRPNCAGLSKDYGRFIKECGI